MNNKITMHGGDEVEVDFTVLPVPNRYRKLLKNSGNKNDSPAMQCFSANDFDLKECLELQKRDWPNSANRALGIEPSPNLCDCILVWEGTGTVV